MVGFRRRGGRRRLAAGGPWAPGLPNQSRGPWPRLYGRSAPPPPPLGRSASSLPCPNRGRPNTRATHHAPGRLPGFPLPQEFSRPKTLRPSLPQRPPGLLAQGAVVALGDFRRWGGRRRLAAGGPWAPGLPNQSRGPRPRLYGRSAPPPPPRGRSASSLPPSKPRPPPLGTLRVPRGLFQAEQAALLLIHGG